MIIELQRFGGVHGLIRPPAILDVARCAPERAAELKELVARSGFFDSPAEILPATPAADSFQYALTVRDGQRAHTVTMTEAAAPEPLRTLLRAAKAALREQTP